MLPDRLGGLGVGLHRGDKAARDIGYDQVVLISGHYEASHEPMRALTLEEESHSASLQQQAQQ